MEGTVETLEAMFNKAESDLDFIHRKLENECDNFEEDPAKVNPVKLMSRISDIKKEFQMVIEEASEIKKAQEEAMLFFRDNLTNACQALMQLQLESSLKDHPEKPEELKKLEEVLGISDPEPSSDSRQGSGDSTTPQSQPEQAAATSNNFKTTPSVEAHSETVGATCREPVTLSPHALRVSSDDFIEVTEDEFSTVSSIIKGRVKLADVNQTYQVLWQHFKENPESEPLSPSAMHKMGLRVTGKTGEAKLHVLRSLKILAIAKSGSVKIC